jgi:hypothetical protein
MDDHKNFPELDRLSIVTAMILLSYALTAFIRLPEQALSIQLPGFLFVIRVSIYTIISFIVAVLAAAGSAWVISGHPHLGEHKSWYHWIIPSLTALVIGVPLNTLEVSSAWWVIFGMGGLLLIVVLIAEYISVDALDRYYSLACIVLTVVSLSLFLILAIAIRGAQFRLYAVISTLVPAIALLTARVLHLRLLGKWSLAWTGGISLIMGQLAACIFYLPLNSVQFGLILLAFIYGLISLAGNIEEGYPVEKIWLEPVIMFSVILVFSIIL